MVANLKADDIAATLRCSYIASKAWNRFFVIMYVVIGILFAMIAIMLIGIPLTLGKYDSDSIITITAGGGVTSFLLVFLILLQRSFNSRKKKVEGYLQDAVILNADSVLKSEQLAFRSIFVCKTYAIEVSFVYNNQLLNRQSTYKDKMLYSPIYKNYINREILIAYSPKHDEVMLIKPESARRLSNNEQNKK